MFGKVLVSAAIIFSLFQVPAGTASAHWEKFSYYDFFEDFMKQHNIKVQDQKIYIYHNGEVLKQEEAAPVETSPEVTPKESDDSVKVPEKESTPAEAPEAEEVTPVEPSPEATTPDSEEVNVPEQTEEENTQADTAVEETGTPAVQQELGNFEAQVVELTNQERSKYGLPALKADVDLSAVAEEKSADMARNQYFSHTSPTYGSPFDMMKSYGIDYRSAGENIAMGQRTPEQVVQAWMDSEGHRQNILSTSYTHIGVGHVENGNYWTQMFIGK
ncbi:CAP domain-containing protein [Jeotgalibacillus salarius]|uniref:SCP domain-containing protein n=1 Tax=Jeotgalibacillus salarius TaxID=546023 RepID=A0A4Y8LJA2_9BACL|nr:CAP domain-containing protein [Jeotgalibacillus salarius]TFE03008.1 hypothetical protein E2626_04135 [Jeotgalibacillus salarius]